MRILITGSDKAHAIESLYARYMKEQGAAIFFFPATSIFYNYYYKNIFNKLTYRAGISGVLGKINAAFINLVETCKPDVIWIFKGMEFFPETLQLVKRKGIKLVNYNPDNPFIFSGKGSGNSNITNSVALYQLHFTYNLATQQKLQQEYNANTSFLPFGFDVRDELYSECLALPETMKACFLGNPDIQRASFIKELASTGISIDVYGNDWSKFVTHKNIQVFPPVYNDQFWKVLRKYRVQINLMRIHNEDSHNMRTFEIPGIGGIMVAPETTEHTLFFDNKKEAFFFRDVNACSTIIRDLLRADTIDANIIRDNARHKSVTAGYTYKERSEFALRRISQL